MSPRLVSRILEEFRSPATPPLRPQVPGRGQAERPRVGGDGAARRGPVHRRGRAAAVRLAHDRAGPCLLGPAQAPGQGPRRAPSGSCAATELAACSTSWVSAPMSTSASYGVYSSDPSIRRGPSMTPVRLSTVAQSRTTVCFTNSAPPRCSRRPHRCGPRDGPCTTAGTWPAETRAGAARVLRLHSWAFPPRCRVRRSRTRGPRALAG